nr:CBS domain-containing protein [Kineobactrum salinum]
MRRNPLTIRADANLLQAIEMIVDHKLTGLTVTDEAGRFRGYCRNWTACEGSWQPCTMTVTRSMRWSAR